MPTAPTNLQFQSRYEIAKTKEGRDLLVKETQQDYSDLSWLDEDTTARPDSGKAARPEEFALSGKTPTKAEQTRDPNELSIAEHLVRSNTADQGPKIQDSTRARSTVTGRPKPIQDMHKA